MSLFHSIWTALLFLIFVGIVYWAWSRRQKDRFEDAAQIPFRNDDLTPDAQHREDNRG